MKYTTDDQGWIVDGERDIGVALDKSHRDDILAELNALHDALRVAVKRCEAAHVLISKTKRLAEDDSPFYDYAASGLKYDANPLIARARKELAQ